MRVVGFTNSNLWKRRSSELADCVLLDVCWGTGVGSAAASGELWGNRGSEMKMGGIGSGFLNKGMRREDFRIFLTPVLKRLSENMLSRAVGVVEVVGSMASARVAAEW